MRRALAWARRAGIKNWGYFIIGLPGETETTIRQTIDLAKSLPLDIALFHVAAPYPGTPFFFEVVENGWFKAGTRWEEVDMDKGTVLEYDNLSAEDLLYWQRRAFREWALRPGPVWTYVKMLFSDFHTFRRAVRVGLEHFTWAIGKAEDGGSNDEARGSLRAKAVSGRTGDRDGRSEDKGGVKEGGAGVAPTSEQAHGDSRGRANGHKNGSGIQAGAGAARLDEEVGGVIEHGG